tara:strand:- start:240 stop:506 length:267 start_codon:yes stop_codon:yes gene_type:complete
MWNIALDSCDVILSYPTMTLAEYITTQQLTNIYPFYKHRSRKSDAEKTFKDGLYYNPKNPFLLQGYSVMLEKEGRIPEAMKLLRTSVR